MIAISMEGNPSPAFTQFLGPLSRKRPAPFGFQKTSSGFRVLVIFPPPGQKNQNLRLCQVRTCRECPEALLSPVAALELQTVVCFFPLHFVNGPQVQVWRGRIFTNKNWRTSFFGCFHPTYEGFVLRFWFNKKNLLRRGPAWYLKHPF